MLDVVEGFWLVQYEGMAGNGGGVVVFLKGKVYGGDSGSTYLGAYQTNGKELRSTVKVHNYMPGVVSAIGLQQDDYELQIVGSVEGAIIKASGTPIGQKVAGLALKLTRVTKFE
jgi:hypothetical protein